jgi:hypothetical protein
MSHTTNAVAKLAQTAKHAPISQLGCLVMSATTLLITASAHQAMRAIEVARRMLKK